MAPMISFYGVYHSLECIKNHLFIIVIIPILNKELTFIY